MSEITNDTHIVEFMTLMNAVLERCDGNPTAIRALAANDDAFVGMCSRLALSRIVLEMSEREATDGIIAPANRQFKDAWRYYEEHLQKPVADAFLDSLKFVPKGGSESDDISLADEEAHAFSVFLEEAEDRARYTTEESLNELLESGLRVWRKLEKSAGLDVGGILRRIETSPSLLVPKEVAAGVSASDRLSLYRLWADARRAFIFGAPLAAMAIIRALLQAVLRRIYRCENENLSDQIAAFNQLQARSPQTNDDLHNIRVVANAILHAAENAPADELTQRRRNARADRALLNLEAEVERSLLILRDLIERGC